VDVRIHSVGTFLLGLSGCQCTGTDLDDFLNGLYEGISKSFRTESITK